MITLHNHKVKFNSKLNISHSGGELSSDSGLILLEELMAQLKFSDLVKELVNFNDSRHFYRYSNHELLKQIILQLVAGYNADLATESLKNDPVFTLILGQNKLPSQPSLSRFWQRCTNDTVSSFQVLNQALLDKFYLGENQTNLIIDVDSTHSDSYGKQEDTQFNAHYGTNGYHPLVAFDGQNGNFLKAQLRPGNVYTSNNIKQFIQPLLAHYQDTLPCTDIMVRGDSGFATPELYEVCEENQAHYLIRMKANRNLYRIAEEYIEIGDQQNWEETEIHYYSTTYQAKSWSKPRIIMIKSIRPGGELLFNHEYLVTNLTTLNAEDGFKLYHQRGNMENFIKEAKAGFYFDKTDSSSFDANHARMMVSVLAYNLVNFLRYLIPNDKASISSNTLRLWVFKIAGKVVQSGRQLYLKLSTHHVHKTLFYQLLDQIQAIQW